MLLKMYSQLKVALTTYFVGFWTVMVDGTLNISSEFTSQWLFSILLEVLLESSNKIIRT